jgi:transcriptional regulator with XRE-family HTH domain
MNNANNLIFHGELSDAISKIDGEDWMFYELANSAADQIHDLMKLHNLSKADLARTLDTSKAFITNVLRGDANLTLKTLVKLVFALQGKIEVKILAKHAQVRWFVELKGGQNKKETTKMESFWFRSQQKAKSPILSLSCGQADNYSEVCYENTPAQA